MGNLQESEYLGKTHPQNKLCLPLSLSEDLIFSTGKEGAFGFAGCEGAAVPLPNECFLGVPTPNLLPEPPWLVWDDPPIFDKEDDFSFIDAIKAGPALPNIEMPPTTPLTWPVRASLFAKFGTPEGGKICFTGVLETQKLIV